MKDTAGSSTSSTSSLPGPSTCTEDKDSKSTSGEHIAIATLMTVSVKRSAYGYFAHNSSFTPAIWLYSIKVQ